MIRVLTAVGVVALCGCSGGGGTGTGGGSGGGGGEVGAVAKIELGPELTILVVGKTVQLRPTALDSSGAVLGDIPFTYTSSDASVATVDQGLVTAVAEGVTMISASANGVTSSFAVVTVLAERPPLGPSDTLIATALANGQLDDELALVYRVYAAFGDARLPLQYKGNDDDVFESDALDVVRERWDTLSVTTQTSLEPFFAPPAVLGSWASLDKKPRSLLGICNRPAQDPNWRFVPVSTGGRVKVWFDVRTPRALAQAQAVLDAMEGTIWDAVTTGLGMKPPITDGTEAGCNGGDGRLDVYIGTPAMNGITGTNLGENKVNFAARKFSPTFIVINSSLSDDDLVGTAAHEFMHACQWAYDVSAFSLSSYRWLKEATAQEAIDHAFPMNNLEQGPSKLSGYLDGVAEPIHVGDDDHMYGSYLFFQFLVRSGSPAVLGTIWQKTLETSDQLQAVDRGIPGEPGKTNGFEVQWPRYARTLWNDKPVDTQTASFTKWDSMVEKPNFTLGDGNLGGVRESELLLPAEVKNLAVNFIRITFTEVQARSLLFHNTWFQQRRAGLPITVQAMWRTEDGTWTEEDWSNLEWVGFCRDQKDQRLSELVLVVANAQPSGSITAPQQASLKINNLGCWGFEGTSTRVTQDTQWTSGRAMVTMTSRFGGSPVTQYYDAAAGLLRVQVAYPLFESGTSTFDEDYTQGTCRYQFNASFTHTGAQAGGDVGGSWTINIFPEAVPAAIITQQQALIGSGARAYMGAGTSSRLGTGTISGPAPCPGSYTTTPGVFLQTQKDSVELGGMPSVARDDGSFAGMIIDANSTYSWSFTPRREP